MVGDGRCFHGHISDCDSNCFFIVMGVGIIVLLLNDTQTFKAIDKRTAEWIGGRR